MCLTIPKIYTLTNVGQKEAQEDIKQEKHVKIAKKEIKVYKILRTSGKSPYIDFKYDKRWWYNVKKFKYAKDYSWSTFNIVVYDGLHAFITKKAAKLHFKKYFYCLQLKNYQIVEMYIPKGAKYILGTDDEIVTTDLIWY